MTEYKIPSLTVDAIIVHEDKIVLIKRLNNPHMNKWALPGGFVEYGETVEDATIREAKEETNLDINLDDLVGVYSDPDRDPRRHTVSVVYKATIVGDVIQSGSDAKDARFFNIEDAMKMDLAFDHNEILNDAFK
ncbi:MAG: NUDIX hydrolase [Methanosphaera stadtmanae]|jgi:8-oxo-dGTP diphosphatase|nr:NUDIX hydrolase [Methanosphaera stadtmanae]